MNNKILNIEVQHFINRNLQANVNQIALAKSPFNDVSSAELANQISAKYKSEKKLPTWFKTSGIYYPQLLSIEQCSSEKTAKYKASLIKGDTLIDLTGGFGIDAYYFAQKSKSVIHCEINAELSTIAQHNATVLNSKNINFLATDGIEYLKNTTKKFDTIYIDPARRSTKGKVFMLNDCTPNVVEHIDLLLAKSNRLIIKTAPLLDISAGLKELKNVSEIHIVSVKNECKELLWVIDGEISNEVKITCTTLNETDKQFSFFKYDETLVIDYAKQLNTEQFIYEPDVALLKSGAFNLIAKRYQIDKLQQQTQLYVSNKIVKDFPGRVFKIEQISNLNAIKKDKHLIGSVIVRNFPSTTKDLVKKYKIKQDDVQFLIFTKDFNNQYLVIKAQIIQHY